MDIDQKYAEDKKNSHMPQEYGIRGFPCKSTVQAHCMFHPYRKSGSNNRMVILFFLNDLFDL